MKEALSRLAPPVSAPGEHLRPFVQVHDGLRSLHFSIAAVQSRVDLQRPDRLDLEYTRLMMSFLLLHPAPAAIASIGMIGLGGGSLARFCHRQLAQARLWVAEINPHVIALRREFDVPDDGERFQVVQADGAAFVRCIPGRLDALLVDGYHAQGLPRSLSTQRFFDDCAAALRADGVLAMNLWAEPRRMTLVLERLRRSFGGTLLAVADSERVNTVVFATRGRSLPSLRAGPLRRPPGLDGAAWTHLQGAFSRVLGAWREAFA